MTVSQSNNKTAGNWVVVTNGDIRTRYLHMKDAPKVEQGQVVKEGDLLGYVGSTGRSEAPHLHYEIQKQNADGEWVKINPVEGDTKKVTTSDNVQLKDTQKMIDKRDGTSSGGTWNDIRSSWREMKGAYRSFRGALDEVRNRNQDQ